MEDKIWIERLAIAQWVTCQRHRVPRQQAKIRSTKKAQRAKVTARGLPDAAWRGKQGRPASRATPPTKGSTSRKKEPFDGWAVRHHAAPYYSTAAHSIGRRSWTEAKDCHVRGTDNKHADDSAKFHCPWKKLGL